MERLRVFRRLYAGRPPERAASSVDEEAGEGRSMHAGRPFLEKCGAANVEARPRAVEDPWQRP